MIRRRSRMLYAVFLPGTLAFCSYRFNVSLPALHQEDEPKPYSFSSLLRQCLHQIPDRSLSRLWGSFSSIHLPVYLRSPVYSLWSWIFNADLTACRYPIHTYQSLQEFFTRPLHKHVRPIESADIVSPSDGLVTVFGQVSPQGRLDQVKGVSYGLSSFLRCRPQLQSDKHQLYYAVVYLGPGDYHRFHSPSEWTMCHRTHIPGDLFPVNPAVVKYVPALFSLNERVVLTGNWNHGFFSMTAVGAYNVGSIYLNFDYDLQTNCQDYPNLFDSNGKTVVYSKKLANLESKPGDELGRFMLGSTIVLVWEAPEFQFCIKPGQRILMGQQLGHAHSLQSSESEAQL